MAKFLTNEITSGRGTEVGGSQQKAIDKLVGTANHLGSDALIADGFGGQCLHDSYASGHMINKSQIIQWYVEYLDQHPILGWDYSKDKGDKNWRKAQDIAYGQDLGKTGQYAKSKVKGYDSVATGRAMNPR